jgi:hypothetical protein
LSGDKALLSVGEFMTDRAMAWLKENQTLAIALVVCVTLLIALAMVFGLDLSWIPGLISRFV